MADPKFFANKGPFTLQQLAEIGQASLAKGTDGALLIKDVSSLDKAGEGQISFLTNPKYKDQLVASKATACIVPESAADIAPEGMALLLASNPHKSYALIAQAFYPLNVKEVDEEAIHSTASIHPTAEIGEGCTIGAHSTIGKNVQIGKNTWIGPNVTITHAHIGADCRIFPGVRIGQDGFGFAMDRTGHVTVPQLGRVIIEDRVEIGANTTIDRGAGPDTIIGTGTRIDNLCQIGHNVKIGKNCVIVAQSGVAGSTELKDFAVLAAQSGIAGHLTIGMGAQVGAKAGVSTDVADGDKVMGYPAKGMRDFWKEQVLFKRLLSERKVTKNNEGE
ncbi:MAG: UDP-3-O-(3-hydroxymyristoyl)glucosamine N-acyltransferase [Micavibrio sp.]|nr:UDP-3-O-(3-hydroxymyristoyl)glucosamine N-acyltransferase [Micavibrio sp.]